jgi:hypothetical protein
MTHECVYRLMQAGISHIDAIDLRRIAMTLHRWHELECGDSNSYASWCITRGRKVNGEFTHDPNGEPYEERHVHTKNKTLYYTRIPDRERGALKRLADIMAKYPTHWSYVQGDPRGASLYIGQYNLATKGSDPHLFYTSGVAVYK